MKAASENLFDDRLKAMRPLVRLALLGSLLAIPLLARAGEETVYPGATAPALSIKAWYKGAPVTEIEKDKTYVVEFWATWCGPCIASMPHITETAKKNPDVTFIGVGIWEKDEAGNIKAFVDKMGEKMDYHVGYSGENDGMAQTWMEAAGQNGIPCTFIVKNGVVQWVGHPMGMDKPLAEIKAGTFDVAKFKIVFDKRAAENRERTAGYQALGEANVLFKADKRKEAHIALDAAVAKHPAMKEQARSTRFEWLAVENPTAWEKQAKDLAASKKREDREIVLSFALHESQKPDGSAAMARKAVGFVLKGEGGNDFMALMNAAGVYERTKDDALHLDAINRALALLPKEKFGNAKEVEDGLLKDKAALEKKIDASKQQKSPRA